MRAGGRTPRTYYVVTERGTGAFLCSGTAEDCGRALGLSVESVYALRGHSKTVDVERYPAVKYSVRDAGGATVAETPTLADAASAAGLRYSAAYRSLKSGKPARGGLSVSASAYGPRAVPGCAERYRALVDGGRRRGATRGRDARLLGRGRSIVAESGGLVARMEVYEPVDGARSVSVEISERDGGRVVWSGTDCGYEPNERGLMRAVEEHAS